jgi:hypothetical protein
MSDKRWVSHGLVDMLIEMRKYDSAAEVVSGSEGIFVMLSKQIGDAITRVQERPASNDFIDLNQTLHEARKEISEHQQWQEDVLETLPQQDEDRGLTQPLRQAFTKSAKARVNLLNEVMLSYDRYMKAQARTFTLGR